MVPPLLLMPMPSEFDIVMVPVAELVMAPELRMPSPAVFDIVMVPELPMTPLLTMPILLTAEF